jgi:hypothetical protein
MLHEFITEYRDEIISRCKAKVAAKSDARPTQDEIDHGVPMFLDQLVDELRLGSTPGAEISKTAIEHGHELLRRGFSVSQVVHEYGNVCQAITELAVSLEADISTDDFRMLNRCLDDAIAGAVTQYGRERDESIDGETAGEIESLGVVARELRNSIHTACGALAAIYSGSVGIAGSTGTVLDRSLLRAQDLIDRLLIGVYATRRTADAVTFKE